jgi:hypothetical protein
MDIKSIFPDGEGSVDDKTRCLRGSGTRHCTKSLPKASLSDLESEDTTVESKESNDGHFAKIWTRKFREAS